MVKRWIDRALEAYDYKEPIEDGEEYLVIRRENDEPYYAIGHPKSAISVRNNLAKELRESGEDEVYKFMDEVVKFCENRDSIGKYHDKLSFLIGFLGRVVG